MDGYIVDPVRAARARLALPQPDGKPLKQVRAAELLDVHPVTLNRIENGKANVSLELLERMAVLYRCSREYLVGEPEQTDPVEAQKVRIAEALTKVGAGLDELVDLMDALNGRVAEVAPAKAAA